MGEMVIRTACDESEVEQVLSGLYAHNSRLSPTSQDPFIIDIKLVIEDSNGQIRGGLTGRIVRYALGIEILWVDETLRGSGFGSKLMKTAESIALEKGCTLAYVDTYSFQAPTFYKKLGYEVFGKLDEYAEGIERIFLKKVLK